MSETPEERLNRLRELMQERASLYKALIDKFGPGVLDVIKQHVIDGATNDLQQKALVKRDLSAVIELLWNHVAPDVDYTIVAQTPDHLEFNVTRCIWADEMRKHDAGDIGYAFNCCYDFGFCQGLNPAIRFTRTKTLMQGDDCCNHTYDLDPSDS